MHLELTWDAKRLLSLPSILKSSPTKAHGFFCSPTSVFYGLEHSVGDWR
jgi:hypothetical protein